MRIQRHKHQTGFTIVELLVATTVFSVVLLVVSYGLLQIGRTFYKGQAIVRTQETTRQIMEDIAQALQFSGDPYTVINASPNENGFCIGARRYSYVTGKKLIDSGISGPTQSLHVLVVDQPTACNGSSDPQVLNAPPPTGVSGRELMDRNMRLANIQVNPLGNGLYDVTVRVVFGDDDLLCSSSFPGECSVDATSSHLNQPDLICKSIPAGTQFCAASELTTTVQRRIQ